MQFRGCRYLYRQMQSANQGLNPQLVRQFKKLLSSLVPTPTSQLNCFNELVGNMVATLTNQPSPLQSGVKECPLESGISKMQGKHFNQTADQIVQSLLSKDLLLEPLEQMRGEYQLILQSQGDTQIRKTYQKQLKLLQEIKLQLEAGDKDKVASAMRKLKQVGQLPRGIVRKFDIN